MAMMTRKSFDAVVIGAGFAGLYALRKLRDDCGLSVSVLEKASDVGGTWFWNRYPGCVSDVETYAYCYSHDKALFQDMPITSRYTKQSDVLAYLKGFAKRYDLYRDIQFNTRVISASFNEATNRWIVRTESEELHAEYLVTAVGVLSASNVPNIPGLDRFKGEWHHTSRWPAEVQFDGKRVGVIGTGSTGVQLTTAIAPLVKHLTVFQRTAQFSVPSGNGPVSKDDADNIKKDYAKIWDEVSKSSLACGFTESVTPAMSVSDEEREAVFEKAWTYGGGFRFMFGTFSDLIVNEQANQVAQKFLRKKIAKIVKDPETARKLTPPGLYAKRPICDSGYYEIFNRSNVSIVDIKAHPIEEITPNGMRTADGVEHDLDMIIFATGFDAGDGNFKYLNVHGRESVSLSDAWKEGSNSYLGMASANFPNMFMVLGPNSPFTNIPPAIEVQVDWLAELIKHAKKTGARVIEAEREAEDQWGATCQSIGETILLSKIDSWIFGGNIQGKRVGSLFYLGGMVNYRAKLDEVKHKGYEGFRIN